MVGPTEGEWTAVAVKGRAGAAQGARGYAQGAAAHRPWWHFLVEDRRHRRVRRRSARIHPSSRSCHPLARPPTRVPVRLPARTHAAFHAAILEVRLQSAHATAQNLARLETTHCTCDTPTHVSNDTLLPGVCCIGTLPLL